MRENLKIDGVKSAILERIDALYDIEFAKEDFLPLELASEMAKLSAEINKEISVYIARDGEILDINVGSDTQVGLKQMHLRRNAQRLSCIRCIHTHPRATAQLSELDLSALRQLLLDSMVALGVNEDGKINSFSCAFLGERENGVPKIKLYPPNSLKKLNQDELFEEVYRSDRELSVSIDENRDERERSLLIGIESEESLDELEELLKTAGGLCVDRLFQKKPKPEKATFVGSGMLETLSQRVQTGDVELVVVDDELSAVQQRNISLACGARVIDRTTLILDIFAKRAKSAEGKLQVELAQLAYRQGHLIGLHEGLSRLAGGIGTRGPGESKLEIDRRRIRERITLLKSRLSELEGQRSLRRKQREKNKVPVVTMVGYTNTGKSSLLKLISGGDTYIQNELFATLDPATRRIENKDGPDFLLVDSVGFIRKLPTSLVEAFKSTLEEANEADILLIVSDGSSPDMEKQRRTVDEVLQSLGATKQPRIEVVNKIDKGLLEENSMKDVQFISAKTGEGLEALLSRINKILNENQKKYVCLLPFSKYQAVSDIRAMTEVLMEEHLPEGTKFLLRLDVETRNKLSSRYGLRFTEEGNA